MFFKVSFAVLALVSTGFLVGLLINKPNSLLETTFETKSVAGELGNRDENQNDAAHTAIPDKDSPKTLLKNNAALRLEELAFIVKGDYFSYQPWLLAKAHAEIADYSYQDVKTAYQELLNSEIDGRYKLMEVFLANLSAKSSLETLEFLYTLPSNKIRDKHIQLVLNNIRDDELTSLAEWFFTQDYYEILHSLGRAPEAIFQKIAWKSPEQVRNYLPRAHIHFKRHIINALFLSYSHYEEYESLLNFVKLEEHKNISQMVIDTMGSKFPERIISLIDSNPDISVSPTLVSNIFFLALHMILVGQPIGI